MIQHSIGWFFCHCLIFQFIFLQYALLNLIILVTFQDGNDKGLLDFGDFQIINADSTEATLDSESSDVTLFGEDSILGKTVLLYSKQGEEEKLVGCAPLVEPTFWTLTVIIIIVLAVIILILVIVVCCLCCYCCCKK